MNRRCKGCKYNRPLNSSPNSPRGCHYCYDTGNPRGCRAENCDKYESQDQQYIKNLKGDFRDGKCLERPANPKFKF